MTLLKNQKSGTGGIFAANAFVSKHLHPPFGGCLYFVKELMSLPLATTAAAALSPLNESFLHLRFLPISA
jgi:hypothetical protein